MTDAFQQFGQAKVRMAPSVGASTCINKKTQNPTIQKIINCITACFEQARLICVRVLQYLCNAIDGPLIFMLNVSNRWIIALPIFRKKVIISNASMLINIVRQEHSYPLLAIAYCDGCL